MDFLKKLISISILLFFLACAKTSYIIDQGIGQLKLQTRAKPNHQVLSDPGIKKEIKEKILLIEECKKYFFQYFNLKPSGIYSKTTFLSSEAVIYLVISSPYNEIRAEKFSFPFFGEFPYLGFYDEKKASSFQEEMEAKEYITWKRPVYAYSTLGYLEDNILSSFFYFEQEELAEIIFHELFHTIFFVKNEVNLNENLANYFGRELAFEFFQYDQKRKDELKINTLKHKELNSYAASLIKDFKKEFDLHPPQNKKMAQELLRKYSLETFLPQIKKKCQKLNLNSNNCFNKIWNNASMAAFLTYESEMDWLEKLREKVSGPNSNLLSFYQYLREQSLAYEDIPKRNRNNMNQDLSSFLMSKI